MIHIGFRGAAGYALIALLAAGVGAMGTWLVMRAGGHALDPVTTHGEWVHIRRGADSVRAYVAYPERSDKAPGIIVIHEIFGLTDWEPTVADRLAKNGYVAVVPDLLSSRYGQSPADQAEGRKLVATLTPEGVTADLDATYDYLNGLPATRQGDIGVIGFCWGGGQSFAYATNNPRLKAAVVCYGPAPESDALGRIQAKVLGVYGEGDARINASLPQVDSTMQALGKSYSYDIYPGTGHGFLKPGRRGSDGPQVERAWEKILEFYGATLR
ncbi:MAG: dienelactone hydrolase family protein [Gemmatimonadales bacterium]